MDFLWLLLNLSPIIWEIVATTLQGFFAIGAAIFAAYLTARKTDEANRKLDQNRLERQKIALASGLYAEISQISLELLQDSAAQQYCKLNMRHELSRATITYSRCADSIGLLKPDIVRDCVAFYTVVILSGDRDRDCVKYNAVKAVDIMTRAVHVCWSLQATYGLERTDSFDALVSEVDRFLKKVLNDIAPTQDAYALALDRHEKLKFIFDQKENPVNPRQILPADRGCIRS